MSEVRLEDGDHGPVLASEHLRAEVHLNKGTLTFLHPDGARLSDVATSVSLTRGPSFSTRGAGLTLDGSLPVDDALGHGLSLLLRRERDEQEPELLLTLTLYEDQPFALLQSEIENRAPAAVRVAALTVLDRGRLDLGSPGRQWRFYKEGWQNWSPALVLPCAGEDIYMSPPVIGPTTQPERRPGRFLAEMMTTVADPASGRCLTAGFVSTAEQFSQVWLDAEEQLITAASYADGIEVPAGGRLPSERLLIAFDSQPLAALQRYGEALARESQAVPWPQVISGWCSWYYYWQGVREEHILENLEFLAAHRDELPVEYVQIDDGYQAGIGDWLTPNEKFPRGIGFLADQIHAKGYKAGLWLAPFMIGEESQLWRDHPEWAVQYKPGKPYVAMINWQQRCYAMDLTRPEALAWLDNVFLTVFHEWGFDYIKIDFLYAGAVDGIRHDPNVTRAQAYRRALELIRGQAGERFILGCGNPIAPSIGIVNGTRIGPDVAPFWYPAEPPREEGRSDLSTVSTMNAIRNVMSRFWMHNRLWLNDPDCILARASETALTAAEVQTLATVIALSGGMALDSDNLSRLTPERLRLVSMLLPPYGRSAVPLDLFEGDGDAQLFELDCGSHRLLGVFNWKDAAATVSAPLGGPSHVFDAWSQAYLGVHDSSLSFELPPHGCRLLALRPLLERPQVLGSTFHLLQGACEVRNETWDGTRLTLQLEPVAVKDGELFLHLPEGAGEPQAGGAEASRRDDGLWALRLSLRAPLQLVVHFGR